VDIWSIVICLVGHFHVNVTSSHVVMISNHLQVGFTYQCLLDRKKERENKIKKNEEDKINELINVSEDSGHNIESEVI
jgi:hypothetical protein